MLLFGNNLSFNLSASFLWQLVMRLVCDYTSFRSVFVCQWLCQLVEKWGSSLWSSICLLLLQRRGSPHSSFFIFLSALTLCHQWIHFLLLSAVTWGDLAIRQKDSRGRKRKEWNIFSSDTDWGQTGAESQTSTLFFKESLDLSPIVCSHLFSFLFCREMIRWY